MTWGAGDSGGDSSRVQARLTNVKQMPVLQAFFSYIRDSERYDGSQSCPRQRTDASIW